MKNYIKVICLILVLALSIFSFASCKKKPVAPSSSQTDVTDNISSEEESLPDDSEEIIDDSSYADDYESLPEDTFDDTSSEEEIIPEEEPSYDDYDDYMDMIDDLYVHNTQITNDNFMGIGMIHNLYNYMPDKDGRTYNEKQIALEHATIKEARIKLIRSYYGSTLAWDPVKQKHDYQSEYMKAFYKNCHDMKELGIDIGITMQWSLEGFIREAKATQQTVSIYENGYVVPGDLEATAKNFAKFTEESVLAFAQQGITNIKYIFAFTECNNMFTDATKGTSTYEQRQFEKVYPVFDAGIRALDKGLKDAGLRDDYKIVGPCDSGRPTDDERDYSRLIKYIEENLTDEVDIIGSHHGGYNKLEDYSNDAYYDQALYPHTASYEQAKQMGKRYWLDETNVGINDVYGPAIHRSYVNTNAWKGTALGATMNAYMNMGYFDTMFFWGMYDQQWPNKSSSGAASEFDSGIQMVGFLPSYLESVLPYKPYYAMSLLTRYIGSGTLYACDIGFGVYISAIQRDDGEWTVVVTNYNFADTAFRVHFDESMGGKDFYRYVYDPTTIEPAAGGKTLPCSAVAENVTTGFKDTLPAGAVAIYTTESAAQ